MTYVHAGKYLRVDLTTGEQRIETIAEEDVRRFYLGSGYAALLMHREMDPDLPPLDPRSPIYIFNGLMSGTFAPTGCRSSWCGRSPLTGIWNESNMGGHWGAELRFAGLDGLVITGRAADAGLSLRPRRDGRNPRRLRRCGAWTPTTHSTRWSRRPTRRRAPRSSAQRVRTSSTSPT